MASVRDIENTVLPDSFGQERRIGDLWKDQPVVLVWLRHYG